MAFSTKLPRWRGGDALPAAIGLLAGLSASGAWAQTPPAATPATEAATAADSADASIWTRSNLLGTVGGLRTVLGNYGISLGLSEVSEVLGNVSGGLRQGAAYDGLTQMGLGLDTQKAFGLAGGTFNVSALQIHGRNLSADNLDSLQTASGIEAQRSTRLWELWYQQAVLDGAADLKVGQQSLDQEFMVSQNSGLFINTMMGWPMLPSADLYAGGPAYPLSSLGVRGRAVFGAITVLGGVFDDNPPGGPFSNDPQIRGAEQSGAAFNTGTGALFIAEMQYALNQPATGDIDKGQPSGLPGTYKLGFWYDSAAFPDQRYDGGGLSLANPLSSGNPAMRRGNYSIYGVVDQMVWRPAADGPQSLGLFARLMGAPGDRNLIDFSVNAGAVLKAPLPGRDNDSAGLGFGVAHVSGAASGLVADTNLYTGFDIPRRGSETFIEATYQYTVTPWWFLQPDVQYTFNPGGGLLSTTSGKRLGDEAVLGLRTSITF